MNPPQKSKFYNLIQWKAREIPAQSGSISYYLYVTDQNRHIHITQFAFVKKRRALQSKAYLEKSN